MKLNKIFKWGMVALILISVAILVWGFTVGFESNDGTAVDVLLRWAYILLGIALVAIILVGGVISAKNNPKFLVKAGLTLVVIAVVTLIAYFLASGADPVGYTGAAVSAGTLKLTDTVLNLTYIAGAGAILAIIIGEIGMTITNKK